MSKREELAAAIDVRWTPEIASRVKGRLNERLATRRRRRRRAATLMTVVAVGVGGLALAWVGRGVGPEPRLVAPPARPKPRALPASDAALAPPSPAPLVPSISPPAEPPPPAHPSPGRHPARAPQVKVAPVADPVGDLLRAADAARLAGRPRDAVTPLGEITTRHPDDPRAAIAAFQLGRVLADDLHDPAQAARAFRRAYELDPGGPLARDARARATEAAGDAGTR